ncbi:hypothetical protein Gpo141_00007650 [Globisporangium polare]
MALSPSCPRDDSTTSAALSPSSLADDVTASTFGLDDDLLQLASSPLKRPEDVVGDACTDITRELEAVEARLGLYRQARRNDEEQDHELPAKTHLSQEVNARAVVKSSSPAQPQQQQEAGQVADEVENALFNCDQLLKRARASGGSFLSI